MKFYVFRSGGRPGWLFKTLPKACSQQQQGPLGRFRPGGPMLVQPNFGGLQAKRFR